MNSFLAWPIVRLETLAAPEKGAIAGGPFGSDLVSTDYVSEGVPVIRGVNLPFNAKLSFDNLVFVSESKSDALYLNIARPGDLVFTQRGTLGQVGLIPQDSPYPRYVISQSQMKMTVDPSKADPLYLYYYFRLKSTVQYIENHALQSGVPHINLGILRKLEVVAPPPKVQRKIAAILGTYDDLIANNQRRITLLESMADEIYREWFVRMRFPAFENTNWVKGLPFGWTEIELSRVADINKESIRKGAEPDSIRYVDIGVVETHHMTLPDEIPYSKAPGRARRRVHHGDILWSSVRPGNRAYYLVLDPPDNLIASTGFAVISPKPSTPFSYLYRAVTTGSFTDQMVAVAKGSAYPATSFEDFARAKIIWPSQSLLDRFHEISEPMLMEVTALQKQNRSLGRLRNSLLPRLISGKLKVAHLDIQFPPSMREDTAA